MDIRIQQAYDYIKKGYREKILLADLAASVNLSPYFFQRLFKQEMKETPAACISRIRLERAAHIMRIDPGLTMRTIAIDCGFSSLSAFSRSFSQHYKVSPLSYSRAKVNYDNFEKADKEMAIDIVYHPGATVLYSHTSMYKPQLLQSFNAAISFCEVNNIHFTEQRIGILTHISFHGDKTSLNYYAGVKITGKSTGLNDNRLFIIPEGKYACFITNVPYDKLRELMVQFKVDWLDKSVYVISDIFAFEVIAPDNMANAYPNVKRKIYIPVKHK